MSTAAEARASSPASLGFLTRWGLALAAPRTAMRRADASAMSGQASNDLLRALGVVLAVAHTRELVAAAWVGWTVSVAEAWPGLVRAASGAATTPLAFVVVATLVVTLAAGRRRQFGRDFDLACVAALAPVTLTLVATLMRSVGGDLGAIERAMTLIAAVGWGGALTGFAIGQARSRR